MSEVLRMLTDALNVLRTAPETNAAAIHFIQEARLALWDLSKRDAALSDTSHNCHTAQGE